MGHSCRTLLWDTLVGHSSGTLLWLWDTLVGHSCGTLLWHTRSSPASVSYETSSKSHASRLHKTSVSCETFSKSHASSLQNERFVRDFLQKSHVKFPKRAFRTRLPPKVTCQVSKTSVSYETSPKLTCQSLQNEDFVRDFLQKSSGNTHRSTHITQPCQAVSRVQPLQTISPSHANPNVTATFTSTTTHDLTIPCACHESFRIHTSNAHKVLRLPRNVTSATKIALPHLKISTKYCACHEK